MINELAGKTVSLKELAVAYEAAERIICCAVKLKTGVVISMAPPSTHQMILEQTGARMGERGFMSSSGNFYNRRDALIVAVKAGQVHGIFEGLDELYGEDLW